MNKNTKKRKFILFDFDGVIADSFRPAFEVNKMMCPHITEDDYRKRFNGNINDWEEPIHTDDCRKDMNFFEEYIPKMKGVKVVPGILGVIENLSHTYALIIISSTITSPIQEFIERYRATQYFIEIMGNDVHKSKVEKIKMVFSKYNINSKQCIFITDTLGDMKEASQLGVSSIGIIWGFQDKETLMKGNPITITKNPKELLLAITNYFGRFSNKMK